MITPTTSHGSITTSNIYVYIYIHIYVYIYIHIYIYILPQTQFLQLNARGYIYIYIYSINRLCQVEVKLKFRMCYRPRAFNCKKFCLGQVVTTVTTLGRLAPMAQTASCVLKVTERTV